MNKREKSSLLSKYKFLQSRPFTSQDFDLFLKIVSLEKQKPTSSINLNRKTNSQFYQPFNSSTDIFQKGKIDEKPSPLILHHKAKSFAESISSIPSQSQRILIRNQHSSSKLVLKKEVYCMKTQQLKFKHFFDGQDSGRIHDQRDKKGGLLLTKIIKMRKNGKSRERSEVSNNEDA